MTFLSVMINPMVRVCFFFLATWVLSAGHAQDLPKPMSPPRLVNDFAGVLSEQENSMLEQKLRAYHDSTSTQIAVVTVQDLGGYEVVDFAVRLGEAWGVGQRGSDNGIVVLVAIDDRKAAIVTGYGLEGAVTDAATRRIRENQMNPNFRDGNFYKGLDEATTSIIKLASGEFTADDLAPEIPKVAYFMLAISVIIIIVTMVIIAAVFRRRRNHIGKKGLDFWTALWLASHMGRGGNRGGRSGWGGGFGGGSSGGGFGGFGGGSFGGGGSGGSW